MTVVDCLVFGALGSFAVFLFYKAFFAKRPSEHTEGGENDAGEADDGTPDELGIRTEIGYPAATGFDRD
jgi:hypothetical protein